MSESVDGFDARSTANQAYLICCVNDGAALHEWLDTGFEADISGQVQWRQPLHEAVRDDHEGTNTAA